jgi:hypothetical protein
MPKLSFGKDVRESNGSNDALLGLKENETVPMMPFSDSKKGQRGSNSSNDALLWFERGQRESNSSNDALFGFKKG